jgi:amidohydrolase
VSPTRPAVLTLATFNAGHAHNVIPDEAVITGTIRAFDTQLFDRLEKRLVEVVEGVAGALRANAKVDFHMRYPPSVCDEAMADLLGRASRDVLGDDAVVAFEPRMGAEDFAFVLQKVPGAMLSLGVKAPEWSEPKPVHTATFDIDETALPVGAACLASVALEFLEDRGKG